MNEIKLYEMLGRQLAEIEWLRAEVARLSDERDEAVILAGKHFEALKLHRSNCQELSKTLIKMCNRNDELEEELARSQHDKITVDHVSNAHELTVGPVQPEYDPDESCFSFASRLGDELKNKMKAQRE